MTAFLMAVLCCQKASAGGRLVIDYPAIKAVTVNTAAIKYVEDKHNERLDTIRKKQEAIAAFTTSMATIKELYRFSMTNIRGFGEESTYYIRMAKELAKVPVNTGKALKAIGRRNQGINYVNSLRYITDIELETEEIVSTFVNVVNNGKVRSPLRESRMTQAVSKPKGDGMNFLDRYTRLSLCNTLIGRLRNINMRLLSIVYVCDYCSTFEDLLYTLDCDTWIKMMTGRNIVNYVVNQWNYNINSGLS